MSRFVSKRILNLDFLGDNWKDCFVSFNSMTVREARDLMAKKLQSKEPEAIVDETLIMLKEHFIEGAAFDEESQGLVKLKPEDLEDLPHQVLEKSAVFLVGEVG